MLLGAKGIATNGAGTLLGAPGLVAPQDLGDLSAVTSKAPEAPAAIGNWSLEPKPWGSNHSYRYRSSGSYWMWSLRNSSY